MSKTTIEVERRTKQLLEDLKAELKAKSLDEAIHALLRRAKKIPRSMFGAHPDMSPFTEGDEAKFHSARFNIQNNSPTAYGRKIYARLGMESTTLIPLTFLKSLS